MKKNKNKNKHKPQFHSVPNVSYAISDEIKNDQEINNNASFEVKNINNLIPQSELIKLQKKFEALKKDSKESEILWKQKIRDLEQDKIDLTSELNLTKKHIKGLEVKYKKLIEETAQETKEESSKITVIFNNLAKKFHEAKDKIPLNREKREAKIYTQTIDDEINVTINDLQTCNCLECADLHQNAVAVLQRVQKEFILNSDKFIHEKATHDNVKVKLTAQIAENKHLQDYVYRIRRAIADNWSKDDSFQAMVNGYEKEINSLTKGLKNENSKEWALNHLAEMSVNFKIFMKNFEFKLETLVENIHYATKHNLFNNWLNKLGDFVGKSNGEAAKIERLLLR